MFYIIRKDIRNILTYQNAKSDLLAADGYKNEDIQNKNLNRGMKSDFLCY